MMMIMMTIMMMMEHVFYFVWVRLAKHQKAMEEPMEREGIDNETRKSVLPM